MSENELREDKFENGIFWELYNDLERQFEIFLEYVPYLDGNENVYSFKLLNLILSIGGHVDSAFKEMARYPKFSNNNECKEILGILKETKENIKKGKAPKTIPITLSLRAFEREYKLSKRKVIAKILPEGDIIPFKPHNIKTKAPEWWDIYNDLKHDVGVNIKKANLQNTLQALAGAFSLNAIHAPAILMLEDYGLLKSRFKDRILRDQLEEMIEAKQGFWYFIETPLFIYDYDQ